MCKSLSASKFALKWEGRLIICEAYDSCYYLTSRTNSKVTRPPLMQYGSNYITVDVFVKLLLIQSCYTFGSFCNVLFITSRYVNLLKVCSR